MRRVLYLVLVLTVMASLGCRKDEGPGTGEAVQVAPTAETATPAATEAARPAPTPETPRVAPTAAEAATPAPTAPLAVAPGGPRIVPDSDDDLVIAVMDTNDIHGYIEPRRHWARFGEKEGRVVWSGGVDWLAGYLRVVRSQAGGRVVLVDAGDMFHGTMLSNRFEGATVTAAMNELGYQAAAVGNHDFDFDADGKEAPGKDPYGAIKARAAEAKFPFLAANLLDVGTKQPVAWPNFRPYTVVDVQGVRVGIIGGITVGTREINGEPMASDFEFRDLAETLKEWAPKVRAEGAQVVIGLVHAGGGCEKWNDPSDLSTCEVEEELYQTALALGPGLVDLLVGAHTHKFVSHVIGGVPVVEAGGHLRNFGLTLVHFSKKEQRVTRVELRGPVPVCHAFFRGIPTCEDADVVPAEGEDPVTFLGEAVEPRPFLQAQLTEAQLAVQREGAEVLPTKAARAVSAYTEEQPLGNLVTRILLEAHPEAKIAVVNSSGMRGTFQEGAITVGDVFDILPFDSPAAFVKLRGDQVEEFLRLLTTGEHSMPIVRGLKVVVDLKQDDCADRDGDGESEAWERDHVKLVALEDGQPLDPGAEYLIVTNEYLAMTRTDVREHLLDGLPGAAYLPEKPEAFRVLVLRWMRGHPVEIGGEGDPFTTVAGGPLLRVENPEHEPGAECKTVPKQSP